MSTVSVSIDSTLKEEASYILSGMGLTISEFIKITLTKVAKDKALPFKIKSPNKLTVKTIKNSENKIDVYTAKNNKDLFKKLDI